MTLDASGYLGDKWINLVDKIVGVLEYKKSNTPIYIWNSLDIPGIHLFYKKHLDRLTVISYS